MPGQGFSYKTEFHPDAHPQMTAAPSIKYVICVNRPSPEQRGSKAQLCPELPTHDL